MPDTKVESSTWSARLKLFDFDLYKANFKLAYVWWSLSIIGVFALFINPICRLLNNILITPILSSCPDRSLLGDFVFIILLLLAIFFFSKNVKHYLVISLGSVIISVTTLIIYLCFFKFNDKYEFYAYNFCLLSGFTYADSFIISLLLLIANYKTYFKAINNPDSELSLIEDLPSLTQYADAYSRSNYANKISEHINCTSTENSFAIGIMGEWGSGKSDFMLRLEETLKINDDNILFRFNPWRAGKTDSIIDEFFKALTDAIKQFDRSLKTKIQNYSKQILQPGKEIEYRLFNTLIGEMFTEESLQSQYIQLNTDLKSTGKRLIVFIDDVDRLTGKEVMEVLRIIRNTANFANTFFVAGIDQNYVVNVLKHTKDFSNEEEYLRKVFQLVITLPAFNKDIFPPLLKKLLLTDNLVEEETNIITGVINKVSGNRNDPMYAMYPAMPSEDILEDMIENIRDLKRFCNSFKISFNILKGEVDMYDLFVLELIKNRNLDCYNRIRNKSLLTFSIERPNQYILDDKGWEKFTTDINISGSEADALKKAVNFLLTEAPYKTIRRFKNSSNFYLYFSFQLFNLISLKEFNLLIEEDSQTILIKFNEWSADERGNELLRILQELINFRDADFLMKIITVYLNVNSYQENFLRFAQRLIYTYRVENVIRYFRNDHLAYRDFLINILRLPDISPFNKALLINPYLEGLRVNTDLGQNYFLKRKEWLKCSHLLFDQYIDHLEYFNFSSINFLYLNISHVDETNIIRLYLPSCKKLRNALLKSDILFKGYITILFRPYNSMVRDNVGSEPYLPQIFGRLEYFKDRLGSIDFKEDDYSRLRRICLTYAEQLFFVPEGGFLIADVDDRVFIQEWMAQVFNKVNALRR